MSDDGVRLWVNNQLLIDNWTDHGPTNNSDVINLTANAVYDIRMEFYENGGGAVAKLFWSYPGRTQQIIPSSRLSANTAARAVASAGDFEEGVFFGNEGNAVISGMFAEGQHGGLYFKTVKVDDGGANCFGCVAITATQFR
jgi:hypothetical protein